jgi:TRAP-type C4-dicarboxylate transport system permease small subunit
MMMNEFYVPTLKVIGLLCGGALLLLVWSWWLINADGDTGISGFLPLLIGSVLMFIGLVLLALRIINRAAPEAPAD